MWQEDTLTLWAPYIDWAYLNCFDGVTILKMSVQLYDTKTQTGFERFNLGVPGYQHRICCNFGHWKTGKNGLGKTNRNFSCVKALRSPNVALASHLIYKLHILSRALWIAHHVAFVQDGMARPSWVHRKFHGGSICVVVESWSVLHSMELLHQHAL